MKKLHLVCNAHLDPVWLWEWEEGAAEAISTFRTAADLCEEFDGFVFNHNEAILYRWVEEYEPDLFARIQRLVKAGRWHIMGGWYLQPDCNMPSGESFVRQILLGRRYFSEKFGVTPTVAINLDPFGHTRGLAQILAKSGYTGYLFCRPGQHDCPLPANDFLWEGYDGSRILGVRSPSHYNSPLGKAADKVGQFLGREGDGPVLVLWGVGNHGGGPSRKDLRDLAKLIAETDSAEIAHSTPETYFAEIAERAQDLPVHRSDINPWAVGCYTSQVRIKQKHRLLENELFATEKMVSAAWAAGRMRYPRDELAEAMRALATSEFHDVLPGSSIQPVEDTSLRLLDHGLELVSRAKARAFFALAQGSPKATDGEIPVLVYNPHPFPVDATVECEFQLADQNWSGTFTDVQACCDGHPVPTQVEKELSSILIDWRKRVVFRATLAPSQMSRFDCRLHQLPAKPEKEARVVDGKISLENGRLAVGINARTGLVDVFRVDGRDCLRSGAFRPIVMRDDEDPWGMRVRAFRSRESAFRLFNKTEAARFCGLRAPGIDAVRVIEDGPVRTVVEAVFGHGDSRICQRYKLPKQGTTVEVETRVHWNEKDRMLKLAVPTACRRGKLVGQVAYGVDTLPSNGDEAVAQKWVAAVSRKEDLAVTVVNDGIYGCDFRNGELRLSLLRSPAYSAHPVGKDDVIVQDRYSPRIDQGERVFRFWIDAGTVDARLAAVDREALALNEKPMALSFFPAGGDADVTPFVTLDDNAVQVAAIKKAEDRDSLIVRLFEPTGTARSTVLSIPFAGVTKEIRLGAFEIRSIEVDLQTGVLRDVDLVEGTHG